MTDTTLMPFGKHKGTALANIPASYLLYIYHEFDLGKYPGLVEYIEDNLDEINSEIN